MTRSSYSFEEHFTPSDLLMIIICIFPISRLLFRSGSDNIILMLLMTIQMLCSPAPESSVLLTFPVSPSHTEHVYEGESDHQERKSEKGERRSGNNNWKVEKGKSHKLWKSQIERASRRGKERERHEGHHIKLQMIIDDTFAPLLLNQMLQHDVTATTK